MKCYICARQGVREEAVTTCVVCGMVSYEAVFRKLFLY